MRTYIVKNGDSFEVIKSETTPINLVLVRPEKTYSHNSYILVNNMVQVSWLDEYQWNGKYRCLTVTYRDIVLLEINGLDNIQIVVDALTEYRRLNSKELEQRYQEAIIRTKSAIEGEIDKLKAEKIDLIHKTRKYKELATKVKEIFSILDEIAE
jgi:hypothetical protein